MSASFGKITAFLAEPIEKISDELVSLINQNIKPIEPVTADSVCIRAMYVVSDEINSFGGRFPADEHPRLGSLLIDSPVLVGHRKDKLPIGRNFHTTLVSKDGRQWIKSYFYWLKSSDGAESLRENIDGGIYKECSIGFTYLMPECSVCGDDIRRCDHQPLHKVVHNGVESTIHFNYRKIERVLETSLVYRGALPDTSVSKELILPIVTHSETASNLQQLHYKLFQNDNEENVKLVLNDSDKSYALLIRQFNINRLKHGARFVALVHNSENGIANANLIAGGKIESINRTNGSYLLKFTDTLSGQFVIQPIRIDGTLKYLFYQNNGNLKTVTV